MTKKETDHYDVSDLYKRYQEERDAMPSAVLREIMCAADPGFKQQKVEDIDAQESSIQTILQLAKESSDDRCRSEDRVNQSTKLLPSFSLMTTIRQFLQGLMQPGFGLPNQAFAVVPVFAVIVVVMLTLVPKPSNDVHFFDVAYLEDCHHCRQLALSSTTKIRNIDLSQTRISSTSGAAKFGRLAIDLNVLNLSEDAGDILAKKAIINTIKKVAIEKNNLVIEEYFSAMNGVSDLTTKEVNAAVQFLNKSFSGHADNDLYRVGQWLERLRLTYENGRSAESDQFSSLQLAFEDFDVVRQEMLANSSVHSSVHESFEKLSKFSSLKVLSVQQANDLSAIVKNMTSLLDM